ncbi:MAG: DUF4339 domain-containing protein [Verrucomicrobia bacterium]|nr:DUF4339 domain-containing protein [Verrucomicrobiota bacterium]
MYKIIGADGLEYGPVPVEQLAQWVGEGRVNGQTLVQGPGATDWKPLSDIPELAALAAPAAPAAGAAMPAAGALSEGLVVPPKHAEDGARQVQGPAIGLLVTAVLGLASALGSLGFQTLGIAFGAQGRHSREPLQHLLSISAGGLGIVQALIQLAVAGVIFYGALKMMKLRNHQLAMVAAILAMVPCVSPCCFVGLPIGIWALVVLLKPEVKALFF